MKPPKSVSDRHFDPDAKPQIVIEHQQTFGAFTAVERSICEFTRARCSLWSARPAAQDKTLLRMLVLRPRVPADPDRRCGHDQGAPHERPVNMIPSPMRCFHMTAEDNVGHGLRRMDLEKVAAQANSRGAGDGAAGGRRSASPTNCPAARDAVALARALIRRTGVLLLDEPLSALTRNCEQTQFELMNIQSQVGITFVFVTHDQTKPWRCRRESR